MSRFFIGRPIVAMVIAILTVIVGASHDRDSAGRAVSRTSPRRRSACTATYVGADAQTLEKAVATPIEQQVNGVDNMNYMYSVNATSDSQTTLIAISISKRIPTWT